MAYTQLHGNAEVEAGMGLLTEGVISTVARVSTGRRCRCGADGVVKEDLLGSAELAVRLGNNQKWLSLVGSSWRKTMTGELMLPDFASRHRGQVLSAGGVR
jgi:hypothetical protein